MLETSTSSILTRFFWYLRFVTLFGHQFQGGFSALKLSLREKNRQQNASERRTNRLKVGLDQKDWFGGTAPATTDIYFCKKVVNSRFPLCVKRTYSKYEYLCPYPRKNDFLSNRLQQANQQYFYKTCYRKVVEILILNNFSIVCTVKIFLVI